MSDEAETSGMLQEEEHSHCQGLHQFKSELLTLQHGSESQAWGSGKLSECLPRLPNGLYLSP